MAVYHRLNIQYGRKTFAIVWRANVRNAEAFLSFCRSVFPNAVPDSLGVPVYCWVSHVYENHKYDTTNRQTHKKRIYYFSFFSFLKEKKNIERDIGKRENVYIVCRFLNVTSSISNGSVTKNVGPNRIQDFVLLAAATNSPPTSPPSLPLSDTQTLHISRPIYVKINTPDRSSIKILQEKLFQHKKKDFRHLALTH